MENLEKSDKPEIDYWDSPYAEILSYDSKDEAIEQLLSDHESPLPKDLEIAAYVRKKVTMDPELQAQNILERLFEDMDEEYAGDDSTEAKPEDIADAEEFVKKVFKRYVPWQCDRVKTETINVKKWVLENCPEWVTRDNVKFEEDENGKEKDTNQTTH